MSLHLRLEEVGSGRLLPPRDFHTVLSSVSQAQPTGTLQALGPPPKHPERARFRRHTVLITYLRIFRPDVLLHEMVSEVPHSLAPQPGNAHLPEQGSLAAVEFFAVFLILSLAASH
ncbi:hypothetical protein GWK47_016620 [Chionoecetes opilio]|uniref:Uncharacterized protein n=1 Tax=Chionoecetes opilio TaxID=41210 RepID=A0A8J4XSA8_CHIOP|nr:hypothetical protein GWK47_016620 [Chionoecetes opilio]